MRQRSDSLKANLCQAQQRDLKTIAPLSHRPIVLTDTIDYRTIGFLHYRPNPIQYRCRLGDQAISHRSVGTGMCRGSSKNSSGAQQEADQQQIKTVQWCN